MKNRKQNVMLKTNTIHSYVMKLLLLLFVFSFNLSEAASDSTKILPHIYRTLNMQNGLSNNSILQMMQLTDDRMLFVTPSTVEIYDGHAVSHLTRSKAVSDTLTKYHGFTHLYIDKEYRLWIKDQGIVSCHDLKTMENVPHPLNIFKNKGIKEEVSDVFVDSQKHIWIQIPRGVLNIENQTLLEQSEEYGELQDLDVFEGKVYAFYSTGLLAIHQSDNGKLIHSVRAYPKNEQIKYNRTSQVIAYNNKFYQIKMGNRHSILLEFDCKKQSFRTLYTCDYYLHTMFIASTNVAYVACQNGYLKLNLEGECHPEHLSALRLPDGTDILSGFNTICQDKSRGIWLGSYKHGVLYASPYSGLFDTHPIDISIKPILSAVYLHGTLLKPGVAYNGKTLMQFTPAFTQNLEFEHNQNALAFQFVTMNYVRPHDTYYQYSINDGPWQKASAKMPDKLVDDNGVLYLSFLNLSPGHYKLRIKASTNPQHFDGEVRTLQFTILSPWWVRPWAIILYVMGLFVMIFLGVRIYTHIIKSRMQRDYREQMLMNRIQDLVEHVNQLEGSVKTVLDEEDDNMQESELSLSEMELLNNATQLVELHLSDVDYGVEMLAKDLCMERTGLYKKMISIMDRSPIAFIRSIRLQRAAELLKTTHMSVSDVAEKTGFSTTSYFSKCFQKEFGCKPSDYRKNMSDTSA